MHRRCSEPRWSHPLLSSQPPLRLACRNKTSTETMETRNLIRKTKSLKKRETATEMTLIIDTKPQCQLFSSSQGDEINVTLARIEWVFTLTQEGEMLDVIRLKQPQVSPRPSLRTLLWRSKNPNAVKEFKPENDNRSINEKTPPQGKHKTRSTKSIGNAPNG